MENNTNKESIVLIHPHWAHLGFTYYYDRSIFNNVANFDSLLEVNNVFPVWNINMAKEYLNNNPNKRVVYYQDGSLFTDESNGIFKYLDKNYERTDSVFYPQCFYVSTFEAAKIDTFE